MKKTILSLLKNERGVAAVIVGVFILFVGIGIAAFAIDFGYRHVAQNELQNAADAGALAGARALYYGDYSKVNDGPTDPTGEWTQSANQISYYAATANKAGGTVVELYEDGSTGTIPWIPGSSGNVGDIQRGHWSFGLTPVDGSPALMRGFYPRNETSPTPIGGVDETILDATKTFINAVKVVVRRQSTPLSTFFGKIFGHESFTLSAEAVGYIGFTGSLLPGEADQPIAICEGSLIGDFCNVGRMSNSGNNLDTFNTAAWTNMTQEPCIQGNASDLKKIICSGGNPTIIKFGLGLGLTGGQDSSVLKKLIDCWENSALYDSDDDGTPDALLDTNGDKIPDKLWNMTLPIISCSKNPKNCDLVVGAVNVNVVWITGVGEDPHYKNVPKIMEDWDESDQLDGEIRWNSFISHFNLKNVDDQPAPYADMAIYFLPDCTPHKGAGGTGGKNYGLQAKIPVIVNIPFKDELNRN